MAAQKGDQKAAAPKAGEGDHLAAPQPGTQGDTLAHDQYGGQVDDAAEEVHPQQGLPQGPASVGERLLRGLGEGDGLQEGDGIQHRHQGVILAQGLAHRRLLS